MPSAMSYCGRQASRAHRAIDVGVGTPNRLAAVEQYAREGGGLLMIGGYLSFARNRRQGPLPRDPGRAALPVMISGFDDRAEGPEGVRPTVSQPRPPPGARRRAGL